MIALCQRTETALRQLYRPDGINLGMNLGAAAGAGVAGHIHMHVLPRWVADANFMTVVAETRILPETLETTWQRLRETFGNSAESSSSAKSSRARTQPKSLLAKRKQRT
jgi:ATP adenylyltransferase